MPSNPNQTPAEPPKFATPAPAPDQFKIDQLASAESLPLPDAPAKPVDEVQQAMQGELSDAADRLDLAAAEDPVLDPIGQNPASAEANGKQADLPAGTAAPVPFDVGD